MSTSDQRDRVNNFLNFGSHDDDIALFIAVLDENPKLTLLDLVRGAVTKASVTRAEKKLKAKSLEDADE